MADVKMVWKGEEVKRALHDALGDALDDASMDIELRAQTNCPVDTGRLQESITHETDKVNLESEIGSEVEYAAYVEFGTRKMSPQPYLRKAAIESMDTIDQHFKDLI